MAEGGVADRSRDGGVLGVEVEAHGRALRIWRQGLRDARHMHARSRDPGRQVSSRTARSNVRSTRDCSTSARARRCAAPLTEDLRAYAVKVEGNDVLVDLAATRPRAKRRPLRRRRHGAGLGGCRAQRRRQRRTRRRATCATARILLSNAATSGRTRDLPHPRLGLHRSGHLRARGRADLPRPRPGTTSRSNARCRTPATSSARTSARPRSWSRAPRRLDQRVREPLLAPGRGILPRAQRQRQRIRLPVSPMVVRSERQSRRRSVPPRRQRQGRHAGGFRQREHGLAPAPRHGPSRRRVRVLCDDVEPLAGLSRARDPARVRSDLRRPHAQGCSATIAIRCRATGSSITRTSRIPITRPCCTPSS